MYLFSCYGIHQTMIQNKINWKDGGVSACSLVLGWVSLRAGLHHHFEGWALQLFFHLWGRGLLDPGFSLRFCQVPDEGVAKLKLGHNVIRLHLAIFHLLEPDGMTPSHKPLCPPWAPTNGICHLWLDGLICFLHHGKITSNEQWQRQVIIGSGLVRWGID